MNERTCQPLVADNPRIEKKWALSVPMVEYHSDRTATSQSLLRKIDRSPAHFLEAYRTPHDQNEESSEAKDIGTLLHLAVMEGPEFQRRCVVQPEFKGEGSRKAKQDWLKTQPADGLFVDEQQRQLVKDMALSILSHPVAGKLVTGECLKEASLWWKDPETGINCRCRPDIVRDGVLPDIKTTVDASFDAFQRSIIKFGYDIQGAHCVAGAEWLTGESHAWCWVAVEKEPPYVVEVYGMTEAMLVAAKAKRTRMLQKLAACIDTNCWPGYGDGSIVDMDYPLWANRPSVAP